MTPPLPAAVLIDMDGTLVDTEPYWMDAETWLFGSFGLEWTRQDALAVVGMGLTDAAGLFRARGIDLPAPEIVDRLTGKVMERIAEAVPWRPGAQELLAELRSAGVPRALVTMSLRRMAERVVAAMPEGLIDLIVPGEDVAAKPDPEPYLRAAALLGVDVREAVAIEDSSPGVASAVASGAATIAVPLHVALPESPDYTLWPSLDGRTAADLADVLAAHRAAGRR